ncbi:MAG: aminotransferase class I/II-fold pyridoxal phosphate-dependent enzyme [Clostridiales bacterium]|nr:aminotransferase class I/II-fold pyridoxal phosphate-dependent enzyme [Clostridiales bacterium]
MKAYAALSNEELITLKRELESEYTEFKNRNLTLDMSRGKPSTDQLDLSKGMLESLKSDDYISEDGTDCRNYGILDGIKEAKQMFSQMLDVSTKEIIIGGNSSLNLMYDIIARAMIFGVLDSEKPWGKYDKIKFLAPSPGYDRHFAICEHFGIEMITIELNDDGPDMDRIEELVRTDETIKGIWCVPKYSNPDGITYSDEVVHRFANLRPAAKDFRIFWDNAYCVHDLTDNPDKLLNLLDECKKNGNDNMPLMFASTAKISFAGSGIAMVAASEDNINFIKKQMSIQTIGSDKINQLRHVRFFGDFNGILEHMKKHRSIIAPKFDVVIGMLDNEIAPLGIASYRKPNGGYFISLNTMDGCAKRVASLCKDAGVTLTPAGVTFPYSSDTRDRNIRIAPTYPPVSELKVAMELLCLCIKLASVEKLLGQ